jgi:3-deoxy-D-manno-octulosonic-acid transferase
MRFLIDLLYLLAIIIISPKIIYRMVRHNRYRAGWSERLGKISRKEADKKCIWIHAVSVGEVNATRTLVNALEKKLVDYEIVLSSTTDTGLARAKALYEERLSVFYFPFDLSCVMQKAFGRIEPVMCLLMELEVWPNLTRIANKANVPVVVVNGRLSDKSYPLYKLIRPMARGMFRKVDLVLAQTEEYAERFKYLGCEDGRVVVTNSLKYDTAQVADIVEGAEELKEQLNIGEERIWVAGGTGPGEERIVLEAFAKLRQQSGLGDLRVAIVPRKPERFDEVATLAGQFGFGLVRYSKIKDTKEKVSGKPAVILGDTMGDLKKFYSPATVVFVGRSLVNMGGSDMMEPAALGRCTIFGPHTFNFKQTVDALLKGEGAIKVQDGSGLFETVQKCLEDDSLREKTARKGQEVIKQNQGATQRTVDAVKELLVGRSN